MASMKTMLNVVMDVGPSMDFRPSPTSACRSKLELSKAFVGHFFLQRMMASKTVEFGVVTFGDSVTKNSLNASMRGQYEHVNEVISMGKPSIPTLATVNGIVGGRQPGDLIDGVVVGQDILVRVNAGKAFNRVMLLITDGETAVPGVEDIEPVLRQMKELKNFALYIAMVGKLTPESSTIKKENAKFLQSMVDSTQGRFLDIEDLSESVHLLSAGLGLSTKPQVTKTVLELSPSVRIACQCWNKVSAATLPSLKKAPKNGPTSVCKRDTSYRDTENEDEELGLEQRIKGFKYGPQYVPVTQADEEQYKLRSPANVKIIGFISASQVPRHHFLDKPLYLIANQDSDAAQRLISALIRTLRKENKVALARYVKRADSDPFLACLMPIPNEDDDSGMNGLLVQHLPCSDDVRDYNFPSLINFASEAAVQKDGSKLQQVTTMNQVVNALTINAQHTSEQDFKRLLTPANPSYHAVYHELHRRLLNVPLDAFTALQDPLHCPMQNTINDQMFKALQVAFPLEKVEKLAGKRKPIFWSDVVVKGEDGDAGGDGKRMRVEDQVHVVRNALGGGAAVKQETIDLPELTAGSMTPIEDFEEFLTALRAAPISKQDRLERFKEAANMMTQIANRNITMGGSKTFCKKAAVVLAALRGASLEEGDCSAFNAFLLSPLRAVYRTNRFALAWIALQEDDVLPISTAEMPSSVVSPAEKAAFFAETVAVPAAAPVAMPADEDEDLFGSME